MLHCFLLLSNLLCFLQFKKTIHDFFSLNLAKLDLDPDPDPHSEKLVDPDPHPHKVNADPQPCRYLKISFEFNSEFLSVCSAFFPYF